MSSDGAAGASGENAAAGDLGGAASKVDGSAENAGANGTEAGIWAGSRDVGGDLIEPTPEDFNIGCAHKVLSAALDGAQDVLMLLDRPIWETLELAGYTSLERGDVIGELAAFTRYIGDRATPQVLAQQLVIKNLRPSADLTRPEEIALKIFTSTLLELDRYAAEERACLEAEAKPEVKPVPTPIEDTILEGVGGTFDTY